MGPAAPHKDASGLMPCTPGFSLISIYSVSQQVVEVLRTEKPTSWLLQEVPGASLRDGGILGTLGIHIVIVGNMRVFWHYGGNLCAHLEHTLLDCVAGIAAVIRASPTSFLAFNNCFEIFALCFDVCGESKVTLLSCQPVLPTRAVRRSDSQGRCAEEKAESSVTKLGDTLLGDAVELALTLLGLCEPSQSLKGSFTELHM